MKRVSVLEHILAILKERDRRYEQRFADLQKATLIALEASEKAVLKAETAVEKRFDAVNEFRGTLSDQATHFITRTEASGAIERNAKDIQELKDRMNTRDGRGSGLTAGWTYLVAAISATVGVALLVLALSH